MARMLPFDDPNPRGELILGGINGSTAYGLATPTSDIDRIGCYVAPTREFHGLHLPTGKKSTWTGTDPDFTYHEAGKLANLLLSCNPTVTELLWLDEYEIETDAGEMLIDLRRTFLSAKGVRNSYLGYATQQFARIRNRDDNTFSSDTRKRTAKHARHLHRLIGQGVELHRTGRLTVRLQPFVAEECREFGEMVADGDLNQATDMLHRAEDQFDTPGVLPAAPSEVEAEQWLQFVRREYWSDF
jgi:predicted nucleotidyltransferase